MCCRGYVSVEPCLRDIDALMGNPADYQPSHMNLPQWTSQTRSGSMLFLVWFFWQHDLFSFLRMEVCQLLNRMYLCFEWLSSPPRRFIIFENLLISNLRIHASEKRNMFLPVKELSLFVKLPCQEYRKLTAQP